MTSIYIKDGTELPERDPNDEYRTERTLIRAALWGQVHGYYSTILDVGAGSDARWGVEARHLLLNEDEIVVDGVEIQDYPKPTELFDRDGWYPNQDFLTWNEPYGYDLVVSNPPYKYAEGIVRKAWEHLNPDGAMVMLLRLAFQASVGRYESLWKELPPSKVGVCSRRPSFYGGGTNGDDYAVYYWYKDSEGHCKGYPRQWKTFLLNYERDSTNV